MTSEPTAARVAEKPFLAGVFVICMCGLMLQIVQTRILSIVGYYHLAFFAIGLAMLGMTAGALLVYYERVPRASSLPDTVARVMTVFAWATVCSLVLLVSLAVSSQFELTLRFVVGWAVSIAVLVPPYVLLGIAVSLVLTRSPVPVSRVYGVDLIGAATGCLATLALLSMTDAYTAVIGVGALGAFAGWLLTRSVVPPQLSASPAAASWNAGRWTVASVVALLAIGATNHALGSRGLRPLLVKAVLEDTASLTEERWNSFSRIAMRLQPRSPAFFWSPSRIAPAAKIEQGWLNIDGEAGTPIYRFDGTWDDIDFLRYDATALAYFIRHSGRAAIVGVGGGRDVLTASLFGFRDVTGVEYNPILADLFTSTYREFSGVSHMPWFHMFVDDARSWFARSRDQFDLIQMSLIDTWAATGAGAFTLSENGLYTVEGWRRFMQRLTPDGVFTVSRWYTPRHLDETGRVISLAMASLMEMGIADPKRHIFLASSDRLSTLIVGRAPLADDDLATLRATTDRLGYRVLVEPGREIESPVLQGILGAGTTEELVRIGRGQVIDLSPTWDRNPFFFNQVRLADPISLLRSSATLGLVASGNMTATLTLFVLVMLSTLATCVVVVAPAVQSARQIDRRIITWGSLYFLLIGVAFMFVEIGLIQRMSLFLGHPVYGLAVALFGIILATGIGSLLSEALAPLRQRFVVGWPLLLAAYLAFLPTWLPRLMWHFETNGIVVRAGICLLGLVPCGLLMGMMFPTGMRLVERLDARPTPWLWAVNGSAGVLASGGAVLFSIQTSLDHTLWIGALCYACLAVPAAQLLRPAAR